MKIKRTGLRNLTLALVIFTVLSFSNTVKAAISAEYFDFVKETTLPLGSVLELDEITYKPEDPSAIEIIDLEDGKKGMKFIKVGDIKFTAMGKGQGKTVIWKEIVHVIPENNMPKDMGNQLYIVERVVELVNQERAKVGALPLRMTEDLQVAAATRAMELVENPSHTRPDGSSCFSVLKNRGKACGENLAAGPTSPEMAVAEWMKSNEHRENMLDPDYKEIGIGVYSDEHTPLKHYWIQIFRG